MSTIADLLAKSKQLTESGSPVLDTELLLAYVLGKERTFLKAFPETLLTEEQQQSFMKLFSQRREGRPIAHLLGSRGFWSLELSVNDSTLIPRPETELLVETALELVTEPVANILDLGTGTGAIALSLAVERPQWNIIASDVSAQAVALCEQNRRSHHCNNVSCIESDWYRHIPEMKFDLIVSNPPYIAEGDSHLEQGDLRFEPQTALVAENEGMADIQIIITGAQQYLVEGGWLAFEHGYNQGELSRDALKLAGFTSIRTLQDLAGNDRVTLGRLQD